MKTINKVGYDVLMAQLNDIREYAEYMPQHYTKPAPWVQELITEFEIPRTLVSAFTIYAEEFLQELEGCLNESNIFWNDDDVLMGIIEKLRAFYNPILKYAYPDINWFDSGVIVEPSYIDYSAICIIANSKCIYLNYIKAWRFWFRPDDLLDYLAGIAEQIK